MGRRLSELRRHRGWTQAELAERLGVTLRDYQAIEGGRRNVTMRTLVVLASTFDVPLRTLFDEPATCAPRRRGRPTTRPSEQGVPSRPKPSKPTKMRARRVTR
ncbi:MAG: helix-turn-helix transcriptional regulator [Polyangiaceae bacterium]